MKTGVEYHVMGEDGVTHLTRWGVAYADYMVVSWFARPRWPACWCGEPPCTGISEKPVDCVMCLGRAPS